MLKLGLVLLLFASCLNGQNVQATGDDFFCNNSSCGKLYGELATNINNNNDETSSLLSDVDNLEKNETKKTDTPSQVLEKKTLLNDDEERSSDFGDNIKRIMNPFYLNDPNGVYFLGAYVKDIQTIPTASFGNNVFSDSKYFKQTSNPGYYLAIGARYYNSHYVFALEGYYMEQTNKQTSSLLLSNNMIQYQPNGSSFQIPGYTIARSTASVDRIYGLVGHMGFGVARANIYGLVGLAIADISHYTSSDTGISETIKTRSFGPTYGGGVEFLITNYLFVRVEYKESKFDYTINAQQYAYSDNTPFQWNNSLTIRQIIAGIGIKF